MSDIQALANEARAVWASVCGAPSQPLAEWCQRKIDEATAAMREELDMMREVESERDALKAEVVALRDENRRLVIDFADYRKVVEDERVERLKQPAPVDPRRVPGAVVRTSGGSEFIVMNSDETYCQQLLGYAEGSLESLLASDTFHRWATREECARHGIPYVDREAKPEPAPYVPKVGDVVSVGGEKYGEVVLTSIGEVGGFSFNGWVLRETVAPNECPRAAKWSYMSRSSVAYLRPATPAERIAAGIGPAPVVVLAEHLACIEAWARHEVRFHGNDTTENVLASRALVARLDGAQ